MKLSTLSFVGASVGLAAVLLGPADTGHAFTFTGDSLGLGQRDVRVFDNFADSQANNNSTADPQFPGFLGAELAIWKAVVEWGSLPHGTGSGDPTQSILGSGGANFDPSWQGNASGIGNTNENVASAISSCMPNVLAFVESGTSDGWRMRFCESPYTWHDGPGGPGFGSNNIDIQAVATHEYGHALGLDHSILGSTMYFQNSTPTGARSLAADDIAGVQAIYGVASPTKPTITGVSVNGTQVTITGTNFSATGNEVWFTNALATAAQLDPRVIVSNVSSTSGTSIVVNAPQPAGPGDVLVKNAGSGFGNLSNAWPVSVDTGATNAPTITGVSPNVIDSLIPGTDKTVVINGTNFAPSMLVYVNGLALTGFPSPVQYVDATEVRFDMPQLDYVGAVLVTVEVPGNGQSSTFVTVAAPPTPKLQVGTGDPGGVIFQLSGLDVKYASQAGDLVYMIYSTSNVPSVLPGVVSLDIGNNFLNIPPVGAGLYVVPTQTWDEFNLPVSGVTTLPTVYSQMVRVTGGPPYVESNAQEFVIL